MKIEKSFEIDLPREMVWNAFSDVHLVAACLPGASVANDLGDGKYKGKFSIKLGPMSASFGGDVAIERKPAEWTAIVSGKGADQRSNSRATGSMTYRLTGGEGGAPTRVDVISEINLAGALAQFGKAGVIQEIAGRLTNEFVRNFDAKLAASSPAANKIEVPVGVDPARAELGTSASAAPEQPVQALDAGNLLWSILKEKLVALFGRITRRATSSSQGNKETHQ